MRAYAKRVLIAGFERKGLTQQRNNNKKNLVYESACSMCGELKKTARQ